MKKTGRTEKLKKLFHAFGGGSTPAPMRTSPEVALEEMVRKLEKVTEGS